MDSGRLKQCGKSNRSEAPPDRAEIVQAIQRHYEAIRTYGEADAGWLLDTARCLYTLKTNQVIAKTKAVGWAPEIQRFADVLEDALRSEIL